MTLEIGHLAMATDSDIAIIALQAIGVVVLDGLLFAYEQLSFMLGPKWDWNHGLHSVAAWQIVFFT